MARGVADAREGGIEARHSLSQDGFCNFVPFHSAVYRLAGAALPGIDPRYARYSELYMPNTYRPFRLPYVRPCPGSPKSKKERRTDV